MLGLLGAGGAGLGLAPALQALTWPFLALNALFLGRGWYLDLRGSGWRSVWDRRARIVLIASTALSVLLWGLRFTGNLGGRPPLPL